MSGIEVDFSGVVKRKKCNIKVEIPYDKSKNRIH